MIGRRRAGLTLAVVCAAVTLSSVARIAAARQQCAGTATTSSVCSRVEGVASIGMTVSDLDQSIEFYTSVLGFKLEDTEEYTGEAYERLTGVFGARGRVARLRLGQESLELTQFVSPEGKPYPADSRSNDRWFQHVALVVTDMDRAYTHLRANRVRHSSSGPQTLPSWNKDAGGISAFYFKDPDGHVLEAIHFPAGKGDPKWQSPSSSLFLGIDHTAIVTADTDRSIAFYRDVLGMTIVGTSENYGPEQEQLNNVFGARLRITALRAPLGPGVELLEYLAPGDGRDYPSDVRANDLVHWHTTFIAPAPDELAVQFREFRIRWISPGLVSTDTGSPRTSSVCHVRDPDGHAVVVRSIVGAGYLLEGQIAP